MQRNEHQEQPRTAGRIATSLGASLKTINLDDVELSDRYRQEYGNLQELAESIRDCGQLQNLVVSPSPSNGEESVKYRLLAGGRRYRAMHEILCLKQAFALVCSRPLDELELLEIEWEENAKRKDFSWQEAVKLKQKIHDLRVEKYGEKLTTLKTVDPTLTGVSVRNTAEVLGISKTSLSRDINLAKALERDPEKFKSAKTKTEADRLLREALKAVTNHEEAKKLQEELRSIPSKTGLEAKIQSLIDRYILRDFFQGVRDLPEESIDFCEIDPPLPASQRVVNSLLETAEHSVILESTYLDFIERTLIECWRVLKENSSIVLWHHPDPYGEAIFQLLKRIGFQTTRITGKWIKPTGKSHLPQKWLTNCCEEFFYAHKGEPTLVKQGHSNIFHSHQVHPDRKIHPSERPAELIKEILSIFASSGSRILVPFAGSGRTLIEAELLNMTAIGFELNNSYKDSFIISISKDKE